MQLNPDSGIFNTNGHPGFVTMVPEPAGAAAMLLVSAIVLAKRRRKKD